MPGRQDETVLDAVGLIGHAYADQAANYGRPVNGFDLAAGAAFALGTVPDGMAAQAADLEPAAATDPTEIAPRRSPLIPYRACHPIPLAAAAVAAAGTIDPTSLLGPRTGYAWDIRRLTVIFGAGTTQVACVYNANDASTTLAILNGSGNVLGNTEILLPGERLVFVSTGGGATISGKAIEIALPWLATYLL